MSREDISSAEGTETWRFLRDVAWLSNTLDWPTCEVRR